MKWSDQQVQKLKEMCYIGVSNQEMAVALKCKLTDVYAKRSQLGITIDKCKDAPVKPKNVGLNKQVRLAFGRLYNDLLITVAKDGIPEKRANLYSAMYDDLLALESKYEVALKKL